MDKYNGKIIIIIERKTVKQIISHSIISNSNNQWTISEIIIVNIKDNGEGIDKEIYPKSFTKFVIKSYYGTGLGLYVCKNILQAHGGRICTHNKNENRATFTFSFPI